MRPSTARARRRIGRGRARSASACKRGSPSFVATWCPRPHRSSQAQPIRPSLLALGRDALLAKLDELIGRLGSSVQYAHRNLEGLSDDDLRRLLDTLDPDPDADAAAEPCRPNGSATRSAARRGSCTVSASPRRRTSASSRSRRSSACDRRGSARRCIRAARPRRHADDDHGVGADHRSGGAPVQHRARARPLHARASVAAAVGAVHAVRASHARSATTRPRRTRSRPSC